VTEIEPTGDVAADEMHWPAPRLAFLTDPSVVEAEYGLWVRRKREETGADGTSLFGRSKGHVLDRVVAEPRVDNDAGSVVSVSDKP